MWQIKDKGPYLWNKDINKILIKDINKKMAKDMKRQCTKKENKCLIYIFKGQSC